MRRSTLLVSRELIDKLQQYRSLKGGDLTDLLHTFLSDPMLMAKIRLLKSNKYTKTYQEGGQDLQELKFYPLPDDWCHLSILSNGTGFSRCYIFAYLLKYYLGLLALPSCPTVQNSMPQSIRSDPFCIVKVDKIKKILYRDVNNEQKTMVLLT